MFQTRMGYTIRIVRPNDPAFGNAFDARLIQKQLLPNSAADKTHADRRRLMGNRKAAEWGVYGRQRPARSSSREWR
jgi:hypothetical protein